MEHVRSRLLAMELTGFRNRDLFRRPKRLRVKIPISADLEWRLLAFISDQFGHDTPLTLWYRAAVSLAYLFGERPGEYSKTHRGARAAVPLDSDFDDDDDTPTSPSHLVKGGEVFLQFVGIPGQFCVSEPFPTDAAPEAMFQFMDSRKSHAAGFMSPFCASAAPAGSSFDCLREIVNFLRRYPPRADQPLLSGFPGVFPTNRQINDFLHAFAVSVDLDPHRLTAHSFRVGHSAQTAALSDIDQFALSGHTSLGGKLAYCRPSLDRALRAAPLLYDTALLPLENLRFVYGAH